MPFKDPVKQAEYQRAYHQANKTKWRERTRRNRKRVYDAINELKSVPCSDCGVPYPPYVMDFDHTQGDKIACVGDMIKSRGIRAVLAEASKCEVVCANCHRIRTWQRLQRSK